LPKDQHDPDINRNLLYLMSNVLAAKASDEIERPPPKKNQHGTGGAVIAQRPTQVPPPPQNKPPLQTLPFKTLFPPQHNHCWKHIIIQLSITLMTNKASDEFVQALVAFMINAKMADPSFVWIPINQMLSELATSSQKVRTSTT
jgi:hypothetical protein